VLDFNAVTRSTDRRIIVRKYKVISFTILALFAVTFALSCAAKADPAATQMATVQRGNLNINILASGNLVTAHEENLAFYSAGTVQQVLVKIGDNVTAGQVLAKLDTAPLQSSLATAAVNVKQAQMNL
jgi:multidrug efflux pump subunit AcrA (membrane-fusion protein)